MEHPVAGGLLQRRVWHLDVVSVSACAIRYPSKSTKQITDNEADAYSNHELHLGALVRDFKVVQ